MRPLSESEKAWLAAAFDFETNVSWLKPTKYYSKRRPIIQICNIHYNLIEYARKLIDYGKITSQNREKWKWSKIYYLKITKRDVVVHVLKEVLPYIIAKREIIEEIINTPFVDRRATRTHERDGKGRWTT